MIASVLLTGANGQLGWEIARRAGALRVHALGHGELDISDIAAVRRAVEDLQPRVAINAAAYTAVDKAEKEARLAYAVNRDGPAHLAEACAERNIPLIHISTDYVFDGTKAGPYTEEDPVRPLGVYGASKLAGEEAVRALCPRHVILRTAWVYGIHGHNFVKTMLRAAGERERLRVVADQRGCPTFARDLAEAALAIARRLAIGSMGTDGFGTFHCAGAGQTTWYGFASKIIEVAAPRFGRVPTVDAITTAEYPTPARRPANSVLDCSRLQRIHGIRLRPWEQALTEAIDGIQKRGSVKAR